MTRLSIPGQVDITYTFPSATTNNGKIASQTDNISGETVSYQYDSLNRLSSANGSGWNQNFGYDGFGNLVSKTGTNSPPLSVAIDATTNRVVGQSYDANGNQQTTPAMSGYLGYDAENRLLTAPGLQYAYDTQNKRIWKGMFDGNGYLTGQELYFYGVDGQKLGTYTLRSDYGQNRQTVLWDDTPTLAVFFGGKRVAVGGTAFVPDRLGSKGKYYPYGEERNSPPLANDQVKFATYTRDSATGLDYADQRNYASTFGRFMSADTAAPDPPTPISFNRYSYTNDDAVNFYDPEGRLAKMPTDGVGSLGVTIDLGSGPLFLPYTIGPIITPFDRAYDQAVATMDDLVQQGLINSWSFVDGNVNQVQISLNSLVLFVPTFAAPRIVKPPASGYWAYAACFLTGIVGAEITKYEVPGVSAWAILQGLVTGAAWGPGVAVVGGVVITVDFFAKEDKVARDCAKATGYTPWIIQTFPSK